jgi:hypothetical protein
MLSVTAPPACSTALVTVATCPWLFEIVPVLSPLLTGAAVGTGLLVGAVGEALLPPLPLPQPLIHTDIPTKSALTDAALNSRRVNG